jgi:hypothetical protein
MVELSAPSNEKQTTDSESTLADDVQAVRMADGYVAVKNNPEVLPPGQILTGKQEHCETNILR